MAPRHLGLRGQHLAQLLLHALHVGQQPTAFVAAGHHDAGVEAALGDVGGNAGGAAHVAGQGDQGVRADRRDQQRQHAEPGHRGPHRLQRGVQMTLRLALQRLQRGGAQPVQGLVPAMQGRVPALIGIGAAAVQGLRQLRQGAIGDGGFGGDRLRQGRIRLFEQAQRLLQLMPQAALIAGQFGDLRAQDRGVGAGLRGVAHRVQPGQGLAGHRGVDQAADHQVVAFHVRRIDQLAVVAQGVQRVVGLVGDRREVAAPGLQGLLQLRQRRRAALEAGQGRHGPLQFAQRPVRGVARLRRVGEGADLFFLQGRQQPQHLAQWRVAAQLGAADLHAVAEGAGVQQQGNGQPDQGQHADQAELARNGEVVPDPQTRAAVGGGRSGVVRGVRRHCAGLWGKAKEGMRSRASACDGNAGGRTAIELRRAKTRACEGIASTRPNRADL
ncbi:hypothetical protein NG829_11155 [Xanthomonas sacchari]|nr:hypothetical protein NG829_11155 [Xanthomonas sacchari]